MTGFLTRLAWPLTAPLLVLLGAVWLTNNIVIVPTDYLSLLALAPYGLLLAIVFLCYQFNQLRCVLVALLLAGAYALVQSVLQQPLLDYASVSSFVLVSALLPVLLMLTSWLPERGFGGSYSLLYAVLLSLPMAAALYLQSRPELLGPWLAYTPIRGWAHSILPPLLIAIYGVALLHQLIRLWTLQQPLDAALSGVILALVLSFVLFDRSYISACLFSAAMLMLIWSVLKRSHDMAYLDELTGLPGRRALNEALKSCGRRYVLAMMDVDHFKKFNDLYGHDVGDEVLQMVAARIGTVTGGGHAYRYGGEEFTVLFKGAELAECVPHLEAVRAKIGAYRMSLREIDSRPSDAKEGRRRRGKAAQHQEVSVTISIGVAARCSTHNSSEQVIKAADKALYQAKKSGRNRLAEDSSSA